MPEIKEDINLERAGETERVIDVRVWFRMKVAEVRMVGEIKKRKLTVSKEEK